MRRIFPMLFGALLVSAQVSVLCLAAIKTSEKAAPVPESPPSSLSADEYLVSAKDVLQITIVDEKDLPVSFEVSEKDGTIKYPYIEYVKVNGLTVKWIEKFITALLRGADPDAIHKLMADLRGGADPKKAEKRLSDLLQKVDPQDCWFMAPQVNAMVGKYSEKLFYVEGQVNRPGQFPFTGQNKMTVYRAIIKAGGFTRIAKKKVILITTDDKGREKRIEVDVADIRKKIGQNPDLDPPVKANDIIFVPESWI